MFTEKFDRYVCEGDTISCKVDGFRIVARVERDSFMHEPWKEHDGHGYISDWTHRDKRPGERILVSDDRAYSKSRRYYDVERSMVLAKKDGWDAPPYGEGTAGEQAARAVEADYQAMRAWCMDEWYWGSVILAVSYRGIELDDCAASLGGIEINYPGWGKGDNSYLTEVANEMLPEALERGKAILGDLRRESGDDEEAMVAAAGGDDEEGGGE